MKKKLAVYELHEGRMVFWCKCSSINFLAFAISSCVRGNNHPGNVFGAPGRSLIA
jgi:hypothetical protein